MHEDVPLTRDLVLVGGGHAHALVLRRWGMAPQPGVRVTVINPGPTAPYTGMLPGHVAGHYSRDELDIDLVRLARFAGARLIDGAVDRIDAEGRRVHVAGRGWIAFDVASVDVGIHAEMPEIDGFAEHGVGAKPLGTFAEAWRAHRDAARAGAAGDAAVIGGGVAGAELALAMAHALAGTGAAITVIEAEDRLTGVSDKTRARLMEAMEGLGVGLRTGARVRRIEADRVMTEEGAVPSVFTIGAAGARPHRWLEETGLPLRDGFIRVGPTLRVEGHPHLFAAGDCAYLRHAPRPKAGVFAVRAAPVLEANLRAALGGRTLRTFRPQGSYLKLISLGGKDAVGERGGRTLSGRWLWRLKDRIDRDFMRKFTDYPEMAAPALPAGAAEGVAEAMGDRPLCGGCGSKVGSGALGRALESLPEARRADVLSRPGDDAAVLAHGEGRQVVTTDHLRAFTHDPATMGRIAAVHALGDVWAMGARPQAALAQVILPRMSETLQERTLAEMLGAAAEVFGEAGADLVGGHTTMGAEMVLGFSVTGLAGRAITQAGAQAGDALILTRPLGTGVMLAAEMAKRAPGAQVMAVLARMATPQGDAAAILAGAHAMTDVTGFGLAGHLLRICEASGVGAEVVLDALPLYEGADALARAGMASTLHPANVAAAPVAGGAGRETWMLHDPQTAGGLLAAVAEGEAEGLLAAIRAAGHSAAIIGRVVEGAGVRLV